MPMETEVYQNGIVNTAVSLHRTLPIAAIRILDSRQLDRLQDVLDHIAYDKEYYVPERGYGMHR